MGGAGEALAAGLADMGPEVSMDCSDVLIHGTAVIKPFLTMITFKRPLIGVSSDVLLQIEQFLKLFVAKLTSFETV